MKSSILTLILFLCTLHIMAQEDIVFVDTFNNNTTKNWTVGPSSKIESGVLVINNPSKSSSKTINCNKTIDYSKNFKIEYKVKGVTEKALKSIKLWFNKNDENGQVFSLSANGGWIYEYYKDKSWVSSSGWHNTMLIKKNDWNAINIIKFQNKIHIEINGKLILTKVDEILSGNKIAISIFGPQIVHFDDFKVSYISNYVSPEKDTSFILQDEEKLAQIENFDNTENNLKSDINDDWQITYPNGDLLIVNDTEKSSIQRFFKNINSSKDFVISYQSQYKSGSVDALIYGRLYNKNKSIYFGFSKNNNAFFQIYNHKKIVTKDIIKSTYQNHTSKNKIKLEKIKNILFFSINDKIIKKQKIINSYDTGNKLSLATDAGVNAVFDNLKVKETYRSINEQDARIKQLTDAYNLDKANNDALLKQNKALMEKEEQQMIDNAEQLKREEENRKKDKQQKHDAQIANKYSKQLNLHPYLDSKSTSLKISTEGNHLLAYNIKYHYLTIWNLETLQQVYAYQFKNNNYIKNKQFKDLEFDWNDVTKQPSIIGSFYNNSNKDYFWFNGNNLLYGSQATGLRTNYGRVLGVYDSEMLTIVTQHEKDKKGQINTSKPKYTKIQFYDFKLKKWRVFKFDKAKNALISNVYKKLLVCYNDKVEIYELEDRLKGYNLIKTIKNKNFTTHSFDKKNSSYVYLKRYKKDKLVEVGTFNFNSNTFINKKEPSNNYNYTLNNFKGKYPELNFENTSNPESKFKKLVLNHNNTFVNLTADNDELSEFLNRKLNSYIEKAAEIENKKNSEKNAKNEALLNQLMSNLRRFGNSYTFNYSSFDSYQIGSHPLVKASNYNAYIDLKAIGKFCDDTSGHWGATKVLAVTTKRSNSEVGEQYIFKLLSFTSSGVTSKTIGVTQKVRGNVAQLANLSLVKGSNGYTITVNTDGRIKKFNVKSKCR